MMKLQLLYNCLQFTFRWRWANRGGAGRALSEITFPGIDIAASGGVANRDFEGVGELFFNERTDPTFTT